MLDGTGWAAAEIVVFMLIATLVGLVVGWILGRWVQRTSIGGAYEAELEVARDRLSAAETRLADLETELDRSRFEVKADQAKLAEREAEIEQLTADLEASRADRTALEEDLGRVRADLAAREARVEALEADLTTTIAAAPTAALVEDVVVAEAAPEVSRAEVPDAAVASDRIAPTREESLAAVAEIAERTAGPGPRADDDLKKVHGIGPKLERTLKELGLTSYRQIANLQPDDIAHVTTALGAFKGRIERDDWMSSAAEEHASKYGESA